MQLALARHRQGTACVVPIIIRSCDWENMPFGELQALPTGARPVISWPNQDDAWHDVARGLRTLINTLPIAPAPSIDPQRSIFDIPALPTRYIERPTELGRLRQALQQQTTVGLVAALAGQGGIGKTYLATLLCYDDAVRNWFSDGILWATIGQEASNETIKAIQQRWLTFLGAKSGPLMTLQQGKEELERSLTGKKMLLVLDDVWNGPLVACLMPSSPGTHSADYNPR